MRETTVQDLCAMVRQGSNVCADSRQVRPGDVFVAVPGTHVDGCRFVPDALRAGARGVVGRELPPEVVGADTADVLMVRSDDPVRDLGLLAQARYGTDTLPFPLFGVTGTNGKTTVTYLLEHLFAGCGLTCGVLGTVSYRWPGHEVFADMTTPDTLATHAMLALMREAGVRAACMEVSSHALDQNRVAGLPFAGGIFTNLTQDHLDYHQTMDKYFAAKERLFSELSRTTHDGAGGIMAVNADDPWGVRLLGAFARAIGYGLGSQGIAGRERSLHGRVLENTPSGLRLALVWQDGACRREWEICSPLVGEYNAQNLLAVQALALGYGLPPERFDCFRSFYGVPGRLERVPAMRDGQPLHVFVDYAHTPDALVNVLRTLRGVGFERIVTVFGCGGDRDRTKRPRMGEAVARLSDVAVLTSDNPRHEAPLAIMADVLPGLTNAAGAAGGIKVISEPDRRAAIETALALIRPGDALLIAGKGHERTQQIGDVKHLFSDQQVVRELAPCA